MSKLPQYISLFLLTISLLLGCVSSKISQFPPLRIGLPAFIGFNTGIIAAEKGFFKEQGVNVEIIHLEDGGWTPSDFIAGKFEGLGTALAKLILLSGTNPDIQAVMVIDETIGADMVIAQSEIKTVADLKGKKIGAFLGEFSEVFIIEMLKNAHLTVDDVTLVPLIRLDEIVPNLKSNVFDAVHTWEPYVSEAVKSGANIIFTSQQTPGLILEVLVFRTEFIRNRPDDIRAFIRGWIQGVEYWESHPEEGYEIISKVLNVPKDTLTLEGINLINLAENYKFFDPTDSNSIYKTAQIYLDFFVQAGNITRFPDISTLFNPSFLDSE